MPATINLLQAGYCTQFEKIAIRSGSFRKIIFPALCALINHPRYGYILFDSGYSERFYEETASYPERVYARLTPVTIQPEQTVAAQLRRLGIAASEIKLIIISHFHPDHIGGLRDFPNARFIYHRSAYLQLKCKTKIRALMSGFLPGLLPENFGNRSDDLDSYPKVKLPQKYAPFENAYTFPDDDSLFIIDLPGHSPGQIGLMLTTTSGEEFFLIADGCWLSRSYQTFNPPCGIARLVTHDWRNYLATLQKVQLLHRLRPEIRIIPSHQNLASEGSNK